VKNVRLLCLVLIASVLAALPARSEQKRLTLDRCLAAALENNPDILRAGQALEAARGRKLQAAALPNPVLSMSAEGLPLKKDAGEKEWNAGIEELVEFPGKRALRRAMGQYDEDAAALDLERTKALVRARVNIAYARAASSQRRLRILDAALEDLRSYSALAQARYAALQTSSVDVSRGMIEQLKVKVEIVDARQELRSDLAALAVVMGTAPDETPPLLDEITFSPVGLELQDLLDRIKVRPSLEADALRSAQARAGIDLARKSNLPDFTVGLLYPSLRPAGWGVSLGFSLPIFDSRRKGEVAEAGAVFRSSEVARRARLNRIEVAVRTGFAALAALREKIELYDSSLLRESERLIQSALRDYQYGKLDSLGLLDFYRTWREVNREYLDTLQAYVQAAAEIEVAGEDGLSEE
jgi:cobalt-zinc-cadmium efflux system outer membrane protein